MTILIGLDKLQCNAIASANNSQVFNLEIRFEVFAGFDSNKTTSLCPFMQSCINVILPVLPWLLLSSRSMIQSEFSIIRGGTSLRFWSLGSCGPVMRLNWSLWTNSANHETLYQIYEMKINWIIWNMKQYEICCGFTFKHRFLYFCIL